MNLSISAPSVSAEQFSTSVHAEELNVIDVGVKKLHVVYMHALQTTIFMGTPAP